MGEHKIRWTTLELFNVERRHCECGWVMVTNRIVSEDRDSIADALHDRDVLREETADVFDVRRHPDGTGSPPKRWSLNRHLQLDRRVEREQVGQLGWSDLLMEAVTEMLATEPANLTPVRSVLDEWERDQARPEGE